MATCAKRRQLNNASAYVAASAELIGSGGAKFNGASDEIPDCQLLTHRLVVHLGRAELARSEKAGADRREAGKLTPGRHSADSWAEPLRVPNTVKSTPEYRASLRSHQSKEAKSSIVTQDNPKIVIHMRS